MTGEDNGQHTTDHGHQAKPTSGLSSRGAERVWNEPSASETESLTLKPSNPQKAFCICVNAHMWGYLCLGV